MFIMLIFATGALSCLASVGVNSGDSSGHLKNEDLTIDSPEISGYYHVVDDKNSDIKFAPYTKTR